MKPNPSSRAHLLPVAATLALAGWATAGAFQRAEAATRAFVFGGGQSVETSKDDTDRLLNPITIKDNSGTWEAGGGLRFYSKLKLHANGQPRWEIRPRLGWSTGNLAGTSVRVTHPSGRNPYEYSFTEDFSWRSWQAGAQFLVNVRPSIGFIAGPSLQSVAFKAVRDWNGDIPQGCTRCGAGKDKLNVRYGLLEVGAHLMPFALPLSLETYWVPKRFELSTTRRGQGEYKANFAALAQSFGGRLTYDF